MITFISGGARSGKSQFAEQTALSLFTNGDSSSLYYIATAKKSDNEMAERIRIHQKGRVKEWQTMEESFDLTLILKGFKKEDVILIDCLTIWLSNVMFEKEYSRKRIEDAVNDWLTIAQEKQLHLIFVSNDVNEGICYSDEAVKTYMYTLQRLHLKIIERSELVVQVIAGLPTFWKGGFCNKYDK